MEAYLSNRALNKKLSSIFAHAVIIIAGLWIITTLISYIKDHQLLSHFNFLALLVSAILASVISTATGKLMKKQKKEFVKKWRTLRN
jgi:chromate transport protein ChrA